LLTLQCGAFGFFQTAAEVAPFCFDSLRSGTAQPPSRYVHCVRVRVGGVRLHVDIQGSEWVGEQHRPSVLAIHGGPGVDGAGLRVTLGPVAEYAQLIVPDLLGHGHSDYGSAAEWSLDRWADDIAGLIEVLGLDRPVLLGLSFGGWVAIRTAASHRGVLAGVIIASMSAKLPSMEEVVQRFERFGGAAAGRAWRDGAIGSDTAAVAEIERLCGPLMSRAQPSRELIEARAHRVHTPQVNEFFSPMFEQLDLRPDLGQIDCPVLVIGGAYDPLETAEALTETAALIPRSRGRLAILPEASHEVLSDSPREALALVKNFVLTHAVGG
jgi:pimeloyl-ACP methyl ester carboxylesterase